MKQQVNLYQPVLYPVTERFGLSQLVLSWLLLALTLTAAWYWLHYQQQQLAAELAAQQQQQVLQLQEVTLYQEALTQRQPSPELLKQHQSAERNVLQKQQLLSYVNQQQQQASQFYSPVLQHLQQIDRQELWLTGFTLLQHHSSFNGITLRPDSVPLWLQDLRQLGYFQGQQFSQVNMQQVTNKQAVSFELVARQGLTP
jgi:hypothetical protein